MNPRHPVELYDTCGSVVRRLSLRAEIGDIPDPAKDPVLADFRHRLLEAANDILAHDPAAQRMKSARDAVTGSDVLVEQAGIVIDAIAEIAPQTEGTVHDALPQDAKTATNPEADPDDRKGSTYRLASRVFRIVGLAVAGTAAAIGTAAGLAALADSPTVAALIKALRVWLGF